MATSSRNSMTSVNLPMPTSALVLDYICLFTHDLKRKSKRWQDGRLKYHTFNKRIMVYDDRGHFIGDAHWHSEGDLGEGDELELDRGGAIVQVCDCTGSREQDLTELLDKRARDVEKRRANATTSRTPMASAASAGGVTPIRQDASSHFQLRHKPLTSIMGTPTRIGRAAIPQQSPFAMRQMAQQAQQSEQQPGHVDSNESSRPAKRRRYETETKSTHARSLFGATLSLSAVPMSTPFVRSQPLRDRTNVESDVQVMGSKKTAEVAKVDPSNSGRDISQDQQQRRQHPRHQDVSRPRPSSPESLPESSPPASAQIEHHTATNSWKPPLRKDPCVTNQRNVAALVAEKRSPEIQPKQTRTYSKVVPSSSPEVIILEDDVASSEPGFRASTSKQDRKRENTLQIERNQTKPDKRKLQPQKEPSEIRENALQQSKRSRPARDPAPEPPKPKEPRTELRIKPRQRRGLLMLTEKAAGKDRRKDLAEQSKISRTMQTKSVAHQRPPDPPSKADMRDFDEWLNTGSPQQSTSRSLETLEPGPERFESEAPNVIIPSSLPPEGRESDEEVPEEPPNFPESDNDDVQDSAKETPVPSQAMVELNENDKKDEISENVDMDQEDQSNEVSKDNDDEDDEVDVQPRPNRRSTRQRKTARHIPSDDEFDSTGSDSEVPDIPKPRAKPRPVQEPVSSGPRITKMARKSIRSREIIGFVAPDEPSAFGSLSTGSSFLGSRLGRSVSVAGDRTESHEEEDHQSPIQPSKVVKAPLSRANTDPGEEEEKPQPAIQSRRPAKTRLNRANTDPGEDEENRQPSVEASKPPRATLSRANTEPGDEKENRQPSFQPSGPAKATLSRANTDPGEKADMATTKPKLVNPATRGKKAARKEDAAGQLPQQIVPLEPVAPRRVCAPRVQPPSAAPAEKAVLPGFARANGGPWSRHAEDLLGMTRPEERRR